MKTFVVDIIPKIQRFSKKLDNLTLFTNQHWVVFDDIEKTKVVFIFRANNSLLISTNGKVEKGSWELIGSNSVLIELRNSSYLFKQGFLDENILALKLDGKNEYAVLINESKFNQDLNSLPKIFEFLNYKYLVENIPIKSLQHQQLNIESKRKTNPNLKGVRTDKGYLYVKKTDGFVKGAAIFSDSEGKILAKNGQYRMGTFSYVYIEDGKVILKSMF